MSSVTNVAVHVHMHRRMPAHYRVWSGLGKAAYWLFFGWWFWILYWMSWAVVMFYVYAAKALVWAWPTVVGMIRRRHAAATAAVHARAG